MLIKYGISTQQIFTLNVWEINMVDILKASYSIIIKNSLRMPRAIKISKHLNFECVAVKWSCGTSST